MFRRRFLQLMTLAGAGSIPAIHSAEASQTKTAIFKITGFSCITCAVGLDVMLRRNKGVLRSASSYPGATTTVDYNPAQINTTTLQSLIAEMGFTAEEKI